MKNLTFTIALALFIVLHSFADDKTKTTRFHTKTSFSIINGFNSFKVNYNGDIKVGPNDQTIESISAGGFLEIEKSTFGNKRKLLIESGSNGELSYKYSEGFKERDFEPYGREWLAEILLDVVRQSGIDAEGRTKRFYDRGGLDEVINEMDIISSNYINRKYFNALFSMDLKRSELIKCTESINDVLNSNYETAELLIENKKKLLQDEAMQIAYLHAVRQLSSNYEIKRTLQNANQQISIQNKSVSYEYFEVIDEMSSNYEKAEVILDLLKKHPVSDEMLVDLFKSLESFSSNYEMKKVLNSIPTIEFNSNGVHQAFFRAFSSLSSDYERKEILEYALTTHKFSKEAYLNFIEHLNEFSSNYELASTMKTAIDYLPESQEIRQKFIESTQHFSSNSELGNVLESYITKVSLHESDFTAILTACDNFSSSYELAKILELLVDHLPDNNQKVYNLFLDKTESLSSSTDYRDIMSKLLRRKPNHKE